MGRGLLFSFKFIHFWIHYLVGSIYRACFIKNHGCNEQCYKHVIVCKDFIQSIIKHTWKSLGPSRSVSPGLFCQYMYIRGHIKNISEVSRRQTPSQPASPDLSLSSSCLHLSCTDNNLCGVDLHITRTPEVKVARARNSWRALSSYPDVIGAQSWSFVVPAEFGMFWWCLWHRGKYRW